MVVNQERSKKTDATYEGPYLVDKRNTGGAYILRDTVSGEIIDRRFPPCLLKQVTVSQPPDNIYEVEDIRSHRIESDGSYMFLVKWVGYGSDDDSWENESVFDNPRTISNYFNSSVDLDEIESRTFTKTVVNGERPQIRKLRDSQRRREDEVE